MECNYSNAVYDFVAVFVKKQLKCRKHGIQTFDKNRDRN